MSTKVRANLRGTVNRAYRSFPFYRDKLDQLGLKPSQVNSAEDFRKLPFMYKNELLANCTLESMAGRHLYLIGFTTGTTARPAPVFNTHADFSRWENALTEALEMFGLTAKDRVQITFGRTGIAGIVLLGAVRKLGASAIIFDADLITPQGLLERMEEFHVSALLTFPSIAKQLAAVVESGQVEPPEYLSRVCLMGESWSELVRATIEGALNVSVFDIYGSVECGPIGVECQAKNGLHVPENATYVEIVNPETGQLARDGEVVVTSFWKRGIPIIRYRTGDIASWIDGECRCGLTSARISRIKGRLGEVIVVGSCKMLPTGLEEALMASCPTAGNWQLVISREGNKDKLAFAIEMQTPVDIETIRSKLYINLNRVNEDLVSLMHSGIIHQIDLTIVHPGSIERKGGKVVKIKDLRG